jgi:Domain of unknown function (DUF4440)
MLSFGALGVRIMFPRALLLLSLLLPVSALHAQDVETKRKLALAGQALGKALAMHDQAALEKLWSPQMIVNGPNNTVLTRTEIFEGMKNGQLDYEAGYKSTLEKIEFFGNIAVTMGEDAYTPAFGPDKDKLLHRRSTNVWQYANGNWMMIARQATIYDPTIKHY